MSWAVGFDTTWNRDIGYGVPAWCDHPKCHRKIDRGLAHVCGGEPYGGDKGCGLYFCSRHLYYRRPEGPFCFRCSNYKPPYRRIKPDHPEWIRWKLTDESWAGWRAEHPEWVAAHASGLRGSPA